VESSLAASAWTSASSALARFSSASTAKTIPVASPALPVPRRIHGTYEGGVKLIDFGIALGADRTTRTEPGRVKGKAPYMSPEQAMGGQIDPRSDLFSLAIVLYELTTRRRLFKRRSETESLLAVLQDPITPPSRISPDYPPRLEEICLAGLARDPSRRFSSATEMRSALLDYVREVSVRDPARSLKELVRDLFSDRLEEKRHLLQRIAEGADIERVSIDDSGSADLPTVQETAVLPPLVPRPELSRTASFAEPLPEAPRARARSFALWPILAVTLLGIASLAASVHLLLTEQPEVRAESPVVVPIVRPVVRAKDAPAVDDAGVAVDAEPAREERDTAEPTRRAPKKKRTSRAARRGSRADAGSPELEPYRALDDWAPLP